METIQLGTSDLKVPRIGLGTWAIGGTAWGGTDEKESIQTILRALEMGMNLIDTAPVYGFGVSEEFCGKAVAEFGKRDQVMIATKCGLEWGGDPKRVWRNSTRERILKEVDDSLRRLRTDYIDLYQIHWPDPETPIEETAETLYQLYKAGKIRAIGVSNYNPEQMDEWRRVAPLHSNQPPLSLFTDHLKETVFRYCKQHNIGTLTWGTLAHALLTGKFDENSTFPEDDLRHRHPMFQGERFKQYLAAVEKLKQMAAGRGKTVAQLAVRWALDQPGVSLVLWGARRPDQLAEIEGVMNWNLSKDELEQIEKIVSETVTNPVPPNPNSGPPLRSAVK
ncbi:aldo/keto reductase [Paenactinomyces guangxiensis]|uniref:Aldo/keto reductase n=1 Tax=Paenactinomyces guangxiensis TaxID=1490290 RepID=A0A7W1WMZ0_9BACL|nr:aldo/keto reductase [Paenactinomyces guangxiensis]MBA4492733.1 aldo/keto reductase [Paenactinomyces guangxiensis]MBH8590418.1 aldo/keto reductase [Paenactinomyces guangxiensis]